MSENYFMGLDGFVWFTGVVEDRNDPDALGRVRVRCLGFHTDDLNDIPTKDLPWATVMHPVTDPSMQGLGNSPSFLVEGSWVIGFFSDAKEKQQPIIMGSLPGKPNKLPDYKKGFNDPRSKYSEQEEYALDPVYGPYPVDGLDVTMPSGHKLNISDTNRLAQGESSESHKSLKRRRKNRQTSVQTATQPFLSTVSDEAVQEDRTNFFFDEPHPKDIDYESVDEEAGVYRSGLYPYNHVFESESGHITEVDDTPGGERTYRQHSSGTYEEVVANGTKTVKVIGNNCEVIMGGSNVYIAGAVNLTIGGDVRHLVKGNYHLEVEGNYTQKIHKNMRTKIGAGKIGGNLEEEINGTHSFNITQSVKGRIGEDVNVTTEGDEERINNGFYSLTAKSDIDAFTTGGTIRLNAFSSIFAECTSGIVAVTSGTTLHMQSATTMTIQSETNIDMDSGGGSATATNSVNINNGTKGAARLDDQVDTGDDPAGVSGSDGSNKIESASATVIIGD
jgi:3D (Asp-Asp-Asp) domain-containing protein